MVCFCKKEWGSSVFYWLSRFLFAPDNTNKPAREKTQKQRVDRASPELRTEQSALLTYVQNNQKHYSEETVEEIKMLYTQQHK